ncbi:25326_t:CDS:2, partial [Gigaspora margarita]
NGEHGAVDIGRSVENSKVDDVRFLKFIEKAEGTKVANNDIKGYMNNYRKCSKNGVQIDEQIEEKIGEINDQVHLE